MLVLLPKSEHTLSEMEAKLDEGYMDTIMRGLDLYMGDVHVNFPRFDQRWGTVDLAEALKALGMPNAFDMNKAPFSGISTRTRMWLKNVFHQAFVTVNENGTEAAAITTVSGTREYAIAHEPEPIHFNANHPFLYFIMGDQSLPLFAGRMEQPEGEPITAVEQTRELLPHGAFMRSPEERG